MNLIHEGAYLRRQTFAKTGEVNYEWVLTSRTLDREVGLIRTRALD